MVVSFSEAGEPVRPGGRRRERDKLEGIEDADAEEMADRTVPLLRKPYDPTRKEIEAHLVMHMPYIRWCPHCVRGRANTGFHKTGDSDTSEDSVPVVAIDYMYRTSGEDAKGEDENIRCMPIRAIKDTRTVYIYQQSWCPEREKLVMRRKH